MGMTSVSLRMLQWLVIATVTQATVACSGGLHVTKIRSAAEKPSQVAVYLTVSDDENQIERLDASNFRLVEDGIPLDAAEVQLRLLDRDAAAEHQTLVLVDLAGDIEDKAVRALLSEHLATFVDRIRVQQGVAVVGFDGQDRLYPLGRFTKRKSAPAASKTLQSIRNHKQPDPSRNLHGATVLALEALDQQLSEKNKPIQVGSLVVIARGPDLARRTSEDELLDALNEAPHEVYAVTINPTGKSEFAHDIGRNGTFKTDSMENLGEALDKVALQLEKKHDGYYLLSYCSPARAGNRTVVVEIEHADAEGKPRTGSMDLNFDADGFDAGCDSSAAPKFKTPTAEPDETRSDSADKQSTKAASPTRSATSSRTNTKTQSSSSKSRSSSSKSRSGKKAPARTARASSSGGTSASSSKQALDQDALASNNAEDRATQETEEPSNKTSDSEEEAPTTETVLPPPEQSGYAQ